MVTNSNLSSAHPTRKRAQQISSTFKFACLNVTRIPMKMLVFHRPLNIQNKTIPAPPGTARFDYDDLQSWRRMVWSYRCGAWKHFLIGLAHVSFSVPRCKWITLASKRSSHAKIKEFFSCPHRPCIQRIRSYVTSEDYNGWYYCIPHSTTMFLEIYQELMNFRTNCLQSRHSNFCGNCLPGKVTELQIFKDCPQPRFSCWSCPWDDAVWDWTIFRTADSTTNSEGFKNSIMYSLPLLKSNNDTWMPLQHRATLNMYKHQTIG